MKTVPASLGHVELRPLDQTRLEPHLTNWLKCHRYLMNLPMQDHHEVAKMLVLELGGKCRLPIVDRLVSRYNRMRAIALHNEITECLNAK